MTPRISSSSRADRDRAVTEADRAHWDDRYARLGPAAVEAVGLPARFAPFADRFPTAGVALDLACGTGHAAVWLARRGLDVLGLDVSVVAIDQANELAARSGVTDRCRFAVWDLDDGLPEGPPAAVILCHRFRDARLDDAVVARLAPGGLLATTALSEVGATPGRFRVAAGELLRAFAALDVLEAGEADGEAWLIVRWVGARRR
jgi:SAM-dependent methyltransferase